MLLEPNVLAKVGPGGNETPDQPQPVVSAAGETAATSTPASTDANKATTEAAQPQPDPGLKDPAQLLTRDGSTSLPNFCAMRVYFLFLLPACES